MAANDSTQVIVGANGRVFVGATTTTAPNDIGDISSLNAGFKEVGFCSEDGATVSDSKTIQDIGAWQSFYPIRRIVTAREFTIEFAMRQWNDDNIKFAFGGGTIVNASVGWKYEPPDPSVIDERSLILFWEDGTKRYMLYIPRGITTSNTQAQLQRNNPADLAVTFSALSDGSLPAYQLFTDDPAFNPSS